MKQSLTSLTVTSQAIKHSHHFPFFFVPDARNEGEAVGILEPYKHEVR